MFNGFGKQTKKQNVAVPSVSSVLLEGKAQNGDPLAGDSVEEALKDVVHESLLLVLVHDDDLLPVLGNLGEVEGLAKVHHVQDILLETAATKANAGLEELGADSGVKTDGVGDLVDISPRGLTEGTEGVDA